MKDYKDQKKYYPTLVSNVYGINEPGEGAIRTQKIKALPKKTQELLFSDEIVTFIYNMERRYNLEDIATEEVSRSIRQYFLREITQDIFIQKISQICKIAPEEVNQLLVKIGTIEPNNEKKEIRNIIKMPLEKILFQYPKVLQQKITQKDIVLKSFAKPLVPNVQNWILIYEKLAGVKKHSSIERGEFLFRSEVSKILSKEDRTKVSMLLKSRDENSILFFDTDIKQIVFDVKVKTISNKKKSVLQPISPIVESQLAKKQTKQPLQNNLSKPQNQLQNNILDTKRSVETNVSQTSEMQNTASDFNQNAIEQLQNEITKNRLEMQGIQGSNVNNTSVIPATMVPPVNTVNQVQKEIGTPIEQIQSNKHMIQPSSGQLIQKQNVEPKSKKIVKPKSNTAGKISFSSNHVLPVEKN
jgi:hypothetical protein